jgi:hypothetical protein
VLEAQLVSLRFVLCRSIVALAGLSCLLFAEPGRALAQAEELPPELAAEHGVPAPAPPAESPSPAAEAPKPAPPAAPAPGPLSRILLMPYFGFSLPVGDGWTEYNPSPRFGALLGWQATDRLSFSAECDVDYVSNKWSGFFDPPRHYIDLVLSPLVTLKAGQIRLGPKIGWFTSKGEDKVGSTPELSAVPATGSGLLFGFNFGLFVPYGRVSVGGLLTGSFRFFTSSSEPSGAHHTMGLLAAVLL